MSGALRTLSRGLRRVYHGAPRPFTGDVVDPLAVLNLEYKPRFATMLGLHAAADPRVAERVALERSVNALPWGWEPGSSFEDVLNRMDRLKEFEFNLRDVAPVIYPLRVEGNVRTVPQKYHGDWASPVDEFRTRTFAYDHDDWAVARDLVRNTLDRPTFEEWLQPRYNATPSEARSAWDVLTGERQRNMTNDPWWFQDLERHVGDPPGFVADADLGMLMSPPTRRADLVQRYRNKMRDRGFGALSYINTGSNEEVPPGANPWSYIVLPGAERFLGKRRGGAVRAASMPCA